MSYLDLVGFWALAICIIFIMGLLSAVAVWFCWGKIKTLYHLSSVIYEQDGDPVTYIKLKRKEKP